MPWENPYMRRALALAREALDAGEVPVGAVIVRGGEIVAEGRNRREEERSALGHAELEAIRRAGEALGDWRLTDCDLYVTLEPCPMCAGAILNARLRRVWFGAADKRAGAVDSVVRLFSAFDCYAPPEVFAGVGEDEAAALLEEFFRRRRARGGD